MKTVTRDYSSGKIELHYELRSIGQDLLLTVQGGVAHIGSCVIAQPRQGRTGNGMTATSSVINLQGHKEETVLRTIAEKLSILSSGTVVATGGIHFDNADVTILNTVMALAAEAESSCGSWLEELRSIR